MSLAAELSAKLGCRHKRFFNRNATAPIKEKTAVTATVHGNIGKSSVG
jgi:hypothetical protein